MNVLLYISSIIKVLPGSTLPGRFRARSWAGSNHYRLVRPYANNSLARYVTVTNYMYSGYLLPRRNHQYGLRFEDVYLELNAFPDRETNPRPFNLEPTALTVIPPCFGFYFTLYDLQF